jgi:hypothetical protein
MTEPPPSLVAATELQLEIRQSELESAPQQPIEPAQPPPPVPLDAEAQSRAYMEYQQQYYQWYAQQQQLQQQQYLQQYYQQLSATNPRVGDPALRRFYGLSDN